MNNQSYENYWKLTLEYTDFNDKKFLQTLSIIVETIDKLNLKNDYTYNSIDYQKLQNDILLKVPKTSTLENQLASTRKAINQCVKLGFINPKLKSYHILTKDYLCAKTNKKRNILFSKILYSNSSFDRSITKESNFNNLNFLVQTLVEVGSLSKSQIIALMLVNIPSVSKGYLSSVEIEKYELIATNNGFIKRKYNQIGYLLNILNKLENIIFKDEFLYFEEDAKRIFGDDLSDDLRKRNPYLHLLYKNQLFEESEYVFNKRQCMVENISYPVLIASHIKPFYKSTEIEAYDVNNGFLLSKNIDSLFDLGYITFNNNGSILCSEKLNKDVKKNLEKLKLSKLFLNKKRLKYLNYHQNFIYDKRFKQSNTNK